MPIHIESGIYVTVKQLENGPMPKPLSSGFSEGNAYRVLGIETFSESSEAYFILANDRDEMWFISNRHFRVFGKFDGVTALRVDISQPTVTDFPSMPKGYMHMPAVAGHMEYVQPQA